MHKIFITAVSFMSLMAGVANAADLPSKLQPKSSTWTGFYAGVQGGYDWSASQFKVTPDGRWLTGGDAADTGFIKANGSPKLKPNQFIGGILGGYNQQIGQFVVGVEADASLTRLHRARQTPRLISPFHSYTFNESTSSNWLITVRPRVGYVYGQFLGYVTAGLAVADYKYSSGYLLGTSNLSSGSASGINVGWTAGAGAEYAFAPNWKLRAEYLYVDLGKTKSIRTAEVGAAIYTMESSAKLTQNIARIGVSYSF